MNGIPHIMQQEKYVCICNYFDTLIYDGVSLTSKNAWIRPHYSQLLLKF